MKALAALAALAFVISCSSSSTAPKTGISGTYTLTLVNAGGLPAVLGNINGGRVAIHSGTMAIRDDQSYTEIRNYTTTSLTTAVTTSYTRTENGLYSLSSSEISFVSNDAFSYKGVITSGVLIYTFGDVAYRYQK